MASDPVPTQDAQYNDWATNFASVAGANAAALKLGLPDVTAINGAATTFATDYIAVNAARNAFKGAVSAKNATRKSSEATLRSYAKLILANPTISPALKGQLGLNPGVTPSGPVTAPVQLSATGYGNGTNQLAWKRNGNARSTVFIVEAKFGDSPNWTVIEVTTRVRFAHEGQTPGQKVVYRVSAKRGPNQSAPSNEAVVYDNNGSSFLSVAA